MDRGIIRVVEDDDAQRLFLQSCLTRAGFDVTGFADGESFLGDLSRSTPDAVCLDLRMPGMDGMTVLERIRQTAPDLPVVVVSGETDVDTVVSVMSRGVADYLPKPIDPPRLFSALESAIDRHRSSGHRTRDASIIGESRVMREVQRSIAQVASGDTTVLIRGESGTGKELVARAVHDASDRAAGPFVAVNCAAIPDSLIESELFGHERGAFTGAASRRQGRFEVADGGTLFLDEIGELTPALQAKLLRVLEQRAFHRLGGSVETRSDFRLLAATHRDLEQAMQAGDFREDLYYRLAVFEIRLPPLRERPGDLMPLVEGFLSELASEQGIPVPEIAFEAAEAIHAYPWPGNVRELRNAIEHALVSCGDGIIGRAHLPTRVVQGSSGPSAPSGRAAGTLEDMEREAIREALHECDGNVSEVGRRLGIARTTLYRKMRKHGLN